MRFPPCVLLCFFTETGGYRSRSVGPSNKLATSPFAARSSRAVSRRWRFFSRFSSYVLSSLIALNRTHLVLLPQPSPIDPLYSQQLTFEGIGVDLHGTGEQKSMCGTTAFKQAALNTMACTSLCSPPCPSLFPRVHGDSTRIDFSSSPRPPQTRLHHRASASPPVRRALRESLRCHRRCPYVPLPSLPLSIHKLTQFSRKQPTPASPFRSRRKSSTATSSQVVWDPMVSKSATTDKRRLGATAQGASTSSPRRRRRRRRSRRRQLRTSEDDHRRGGEAERRGLRGEDGVKNGGKRSTGFQGSVQRSFVAVQGCSSPTSCVR